MFVNDERKIIHLVIFLITVTNCIQNVFWCYVIRETKPMLLGHINRIFDGILLLDTRVINLIKGGMWVSVYVLAWETWIFFKI